MKRNILNYAAQGHAKLRKHEAYGMSMDDVKDLMQLFFTHARKWRSVTSGAYEAIVEAYAAGFEAGHRCAKKHK